MRHRSARTVLTPRSAFRWFAPPELSRLELQQHARALWIVSWPFFATVTVILAVAVLVEPRTLVRRAITIAAVGVLMTILHTISRAGRPVLASWILVLGLSCIVTQRAWITGGIHAPVAVFYVLFVVMAGELIGGRGALVTAAACVVGAIVLTIGTALQWLTPRPGVGSPIGGLVFVILAVGLALVVRALVTLRLRHEGPALGTVPLLVHDMRSPLQVLLGNLELLRENIGGERVKDVEAAIDGANALQRMTNYILDAGRLEAGRMPLERSVTDLSALAHAVVATVRALQPTRDIRVQSRGVCVCNCDPELTRRIIDNLVNNAVKHTAVEGQVRVVIACSDATAYIAVHDEGPGVPPGRRTRIFEPYSAERLRSTTGYESSGLGLAFCKLAVEAQGGSIRLEDGRRHGSVFIVELPR